MRRTSGVRHTRGPSQRQLRVGEELRHALVHILDHAHFHDPALASVSVTVTEVRASPDLKNATAFVIPLGGADIAGTVRALNKAAGYFRRELGREMTLRYVPAVRFEPDTSFDYSDRIEALLNRPDVARDLKKPFGEDGDDGA